MLDYYFYDRLMRGDLLLVDPRTSYVPAGVEVVSPAPAPEVTTVATAAATPASGSKRARPTLDTVVDDRSTQEPQGVLPPA